MRLFIVILVFIGVALSTNPSEQDHREAVQEELFEAAGIKSGFITDAVTYAALKNYVLTESYFLFSVTVIKGVAVGFGAFGHVWIFTDKLTNKL